jgi:gliding motility-associated-like protein
LPVGVSLAGVLEGKVKRQTGEDVGKYLIEQGDLKASSNYQLVFKSDSLEILPALLISMTDLPEIKTPWSVLPSFPAEVKFMTQEGKWVNLPMAWQHQGLDYFKRGEVLVTGKIDSKNYLLSDGLEPKIKVAVLPKAAPQDLIFHANPEAAALVGTLEVIDSIDDKHQIRLSSGGADNSLFEIKEHELHWAKGAKPKSKSRFEIDLEVEDRDGNILKKRLSLEFKEHQQQEVSSDIINSFSPNGDGVNDTWMISDQVVEGKFKVSVVDSSGKLVFQSQSPDKRWDGLFLGSQVPEGTYYWIFENDGKLRRGFLNLLRGR